MHPLLLIGHSKKTGGNEIVSPGRLWRLPEPKAPKRTKRLCHPMTCINHVTQGVPPHVPADVKVCALGKLPGISSKPRSSNETDNEHGSMRRFSCCIFRSTVPYLLVQQSAISCFPHPIIRCFAKRETRLFSVANVSHPVRAIMSSWTEPCCPHFSSGVLQRQKERIRVRVGSTKLCRISVLFDIRVPSLVFCTQPACDCCDFCNSRIFTNKPFQHRFEQWVRGNFMQRLCNDGRFGCINPIANSGTTSIHRNPL
mmetsp:Transcript_51243/g.76556  ORF Transcript_51243/g.76556 Transcript_51243/m.76556 type:complete len:255 (-) Transcript_51243:21-785(-)